MSSRTKEKFLRWRDAALRGDEVMIPPEPQFLEHPRRRQAYLRGWYDAMSNVMQELEQE